MVAASPAVDDAGDVVLRLDGISKRFGALLANDDISFTLRRGEMVALLGENGAGKTTLMNILFGHYVADRGHIEAFGAALAPGSPRAAIAAGIGMVHQHFTLADNLTVLDNVILGTEPLWRLASDRSGARRRLAELGQAFGLAVAPDARVSALSVGERQRVEILKALYRDARILILDEPTAVLTPAESLALFQTLRTLVGEGLSVILISHKLNEVMAASDRVLVLRSGRLVAERETRSTSRAELAELMVGREVKAPKLIPRQPGECLLRLADVTVEGGHGAPKLDAVSLDLQGGEIVGIAGVSGNGQSTLSDLLCGLLPPSRGTVEILGAVPGHWTPRAMTSLGVARVPEDRHAQGIVADMTVTENAIAERYRTRDYCRHGLLDWSAARAFAERLIASYDIRCPGPNARVRDMSGGNMQKLILGRGLSQSPRIVIANQPTRGLDVGAVAYVHGELIAARDRGAAILVISEDLDELLEISDRIAVMYGGQLSEPLPRGQVTVGMLGRLMAGHGFHPPRASADAA